MERTEKDKSFTVDSNNRRMGFDIDGCSTKLSGKVNKNFNIYQHMYKFSM